VLVSPVQHTARHASLYNPIPFVLKPIGADLSPSDRLNYRLRTVLTINNIQYVAYYLKKLDLSAVTPTVELRNVQDTVITVSNFTPDQSDLSPTPPSISNVNLNILTETT